MKENNEVIIVINENSQLYNQFNNSQLSDELREYIYSLVFFSFKTKYDTRRYDKLVKAKIYFREYE